MKNKLFLFLLALSVLAWAQSDPEAKKGVLISFYDGAKATGFQPGQIVSYITTNDLIKKYVLLTDGKRRDDVYANLIIPYDPLFSPSRVFVYLSNSDEPIWSTEKRTELSNRYLLIKNTCENFPTHPLREELLALLCRESESFDSYASDGKTDYSLPREAIKKYLREFPEGRYRDEFKWRQVMLENYQYEYEGNPEGPVSEIKAYEKFLKNNPTSTSADQVRLKIAKLYRIAAECIASGSPEWFASGQSAFRIEDATRFRGKARRLFLQLLGSGDIKTRETARIALYNMDHGRHCYEGNGESDL